MFKCRESACKKKFKREQDEKTHWVKMHSIKVPFVYGKRRGRPKKNIVTLHDAVNALKVKQDSLGEVITLLEGML